MIWFGFGFNGFGQICSPKSGEPILSNEDVEIKIVVPVRLRDYGPDRERRCHISASWSQRAFLQLEGDRHVCMGCSQADPPSQTVCVCVPQSHGCQDALVSERYLTLAFTDKIECWGFDATDSVPVWKMECMGLETAGIPAPLPLVLGGYVVSTLPFFQPLSPHLCAVSLALGMEHAVLLTASGTMYTWGSSSHGQLGHGELGREEEPRPVEALWGVAIRGVAAGGWHSICISDGGDMYTWGWNESGQLGLPSHSVQGDRLCRTAADQEVGMQKEEEGPVSSEVFISIQAFPALLDLPQEVEVTKVSCGSRHTAAITSAGDLYTWGWGEYGQLGQVTTSSSDQPIQVGFFADHGLHVIDVVCGPWNTFVCAVENKSPTSLKPTHQLLDF
ncbi:RCC1 domain-containing protein 1-like isoform X1 [Megalops cyprinoides]|uniref:RCC1 domain-containing protein 1-like isoform X1 n=1 Tax=Megalops cyprinoides TaxID=118141 RepID=UPI001864A2E4|nr:RCC1 domain-containing protein 1-like isoform X1 [Megalops cyprinoides]